MSTRKFFYDTEFLDDGMTIDLISIGIVTDEGDEYYAVNSDFDQNRLKNNKWMVENVVTGLPLRIEPSKVGNGYSYHWALDDTSTSLKPKWVIANEVREFITECIRFGDTPALWADYAAYDHVALAQLWGSMMRLPAGIPMWTHDIQQLLERLPGSFQKPEQSSGEHNALADARHNRQVYDAAMAALT